MQKHRKMVTSNKHQSPTTMRSVRKLQKCTATNPVNTNFSVHYTFVILNIFCLTWNLIAEATFFIYNLHDVKVCTSGMPALCQLITTLYKVLYLTIKNKSGFNLFLAFESYAKARRSISKSRAFYDKAEKISTRLINWWTICLTLCVPIYVIPPIARQINLFVVQDDVNEPTYPTPFKHVYFYSINSILVYILTMLMGSLSFFLLVITFASVDGTFFCYCIYVQAFLKDLQTMFKLNATQDNVAQLKDAIKFHTDILQLISQLNNLFSPIIFAQFLDSTVIICTMIFQSTLEQSLYIEIVKLYIFIIVLSSQIFIYSYFGTTVFNESYNIATAAYSCEWTDPGLKHKLQIQKYILFIIQRSQKGVEFDGFKFFKCNLQTFVSIMKASFSILAVLQSISN